MAIRQPAERLDTTLQEDYRELFPHASAADAIIALRAELDWTQAELANRIGSTQSVIARAESGSHTFQISLLDRIAGAAGVAWRPVFEPMWTGAQNVVRLTNPAGGHLDGYRVILIEDPTQEPREEEASIRLVLNAS